MTDAEIEASKAPLMDHLIELRARLIKALARFPRDVRRLLLLRQGHLQYSACPFRACRGTRRAADLHGAAGIFLHPDPGRDFRRGGFSPVRWFSRRFTPSSRRASIGTSARAFAPYLFATPIFFALGALLVYFVVMPNLLRFFIGMQQAKEPGRPQIELLPRVSEYLSLIMTLIFAFGVTFQLPVVLTLLGQRRHHRFGLSARQTALRHRAGFHHLGGADAARYLFHACACGAGAASLRGFDYFGRGDREKRAAASSGGST